MLRDIRFGTLAVIYALGGFGCAVVLSLGSLLLTTVFRDQFERRFDMSAVGLLQELVVWLSVVSLLATAIMLLVTWLSLRFIAVTFRDKANDTNPSNQAMQRTAPRSDA